jgi:hypothetical protein
MEEERMATQQTTSKAEAKLDTTLADQVNAQMQTPATKKERRSWSVRLEGGKDERMEVRLERRKDGWRTFALHSTGAAKNRKHARGETKMHADERSARAAWDALTAAAIKTGWRRRESRGGGFAARPDAFTMATLPKPTGAGKGGR